MNFLAHFHLAWPDEGLIAGGLEGDFYKGPLAPGLSAPLARGIRLHRMIDSYTDGHPVTVELRTVLPGSLRRYAGIVLDLCFDHYLCLHWHRFCATPQAEFNAAVYDILQRWQSQLSPGASGMLDRLVQHDLLALYANWDTVTASAARIGERFKRHNPFLEIDEQLQSVRPQLEAGFLDFYPDLQAWCAERRGNIAV